ncbi:hypothetical protein L3X38_025761 [Prunus dulcis]|uniref:RNase H type-1 domain-containing protein n=1 Tax=Prunus dulcis TaxID=3755 RepID=A0AAD4W2G2_PRUDU|nr:hypothetical protein L3X38_025761 [Prunus dulcis]
MPAEPRQIIFQYAVEWYSSNKPCTGTSNQTLTQLSWNRPSPGGCKINSDGSRNNTTDQIGSAGVLRDATGAWLKGYSVKLGLHIFEEMPACITDILAADSRGDSRPRLLCF